MRTPDDVTSKRTVAGDGGTPVPASDPSATIDRMLTGRSPQIIIERLLAQGRIHDAVRRAQRDQLPAAPALFERALRQYMRASRPRLARSLSEASGIPPKSDVLGIYAALYRAEDEDDAAEVLEEWRASLSS